MATARRAGPRRHRPADLHVRFHRRPWASSSRTPTSQYMGSAIGANSDLSAADHALLILPLFHVNAIAVSFLAPVLAGGQPPSPAASRYRGSSTTSPACAPPTSRPYRPSTRSSCPRCRRTPTCRRCASPSAGGTHLPGATRQGAGRAGPTHPGGLRPHRGHVRVGVQPAAWAAQARHRGPGPARAADRDRRR